MKKLICLFLIVLTAVQFGISQEYISTNRIPVGLEYNILFNADQVYKVSQTGTAKLSIPYLFNGAFAPSYTSTAPSASSPTVVLIEGLPKKHIQQGAWVGWSTRWWNAKKFKIEGYDEYYGNGWTTIADYSTTDYSGYSFYAKAPYGAYTKLRFTFYEATGTNGRLGVSELFFIHPEACSPYENLIPKSLSTVGLYSSDNSTATNAYGEKLYFNGAFHNTDRLWIARYNVMPSPNSTELRVNVGDDNNQAGDKFVIGLTNSSGWIPKFTFQSNARLGIGTSNPQASLDVNGNIRAERVDVISDVPSSDYVFQPSYNLRPLEEVEQFVKENKHLPEVPSAAEFKENGYSVGEMDDILLRKVEELTLYIIKQQKLIGQLQTEVRQLKTKE